MPPNLLRPSWSQLDPHELRILLAERIGSPGQYDGIGNDPDRLHLPLARESCRVILTFCNRRIARIEPGHAFNASEWDHIANEIENSILVGPTKIGRDYAFSSYRVHGSWRGERSGVQILPPHPSAPQASFEMAEHPFILEFPIQFSEVWPITNHRRLRELRHLTLLLNVLLAGRTNLQPSRGSHFWGCIHQDSGGLGEVRWVQNFYFAGMGEVFLDTPSPMTEQQLEVIPADRYFKEVRGIDGRGLRVPSDLDDSICRYRQLHPRRREEFNRSAYWLDMASRQWNMSMSASFSALVSAVESLINARGPGSTGRFRTFLERYAPGASLEARRNEMYDLRSGILHGSELMTLDQDLSFGWDPPWWNERELHEELWRMARQVLRNWLNNPPPV